MLNKLWLWLGKRGWFKHDGLVGAGPSWYPRAYVEYDDGGCSILMTVGNACSYAKMFKGTVYMAGTGPRYKRDLRSWV